MKRLIRKPVKVVRKRNFEVAVMNRARKDERYIPIGVRLPISP